MAHNKTTNAQLYKPDSINERIDSQKMFIDNISQSETNYNKFVTSIADLEAQTRLLAMSGKLSTYRTGKDANGIFTTNTYKRQDGTTYKTSVLSGGTSPKYTARTIKYYDDAGTTVTKQFVYALTYDAEGLFISEVIA